MGPTHVSPACVCSLTVIYAYTSRVPLLCAAMHVLADAARVIRARPPAAPGVRSQGYVSVQQQRTPLC